MVAQSAFAFAQDTKIGLLFDVTGPIANFIPPMQDAAKLAIDEINQGSGILKGEIDRCLW